MINYLEQNSEQIEFIPVCLTCGTELFATEEKCKDGVWRVRIEMCKRCYNEMLCMRSQEK